MNKKLATAIAIFVFTLASYALTQYENREIDGPCSGTFNGTVTEVIDGDTIRISSCEERIRLALVNTPEKGNANYTAAKEFTSQSCLGKHTTVNQDKKQRTDQYGRIVGVVYCDGVNINEKLLENNLAVFMNNYCSKSEFRYEEWSRC